MRICLLRTSLRSNHVLVCAMADKRLHSAAYRASLEACWKVDVDWDLYPPKLTDVSLRSGVMSLIVD